MTINNLTLNPSQETALTSEATEIFFTGGLGSGKTFSLGSFTFNKASVEGAVGLLAAPTGQVLKDSTFPQVQESWEKMGIVESKDYVVQVRPPADWGVKVLSKLSSDKVVTFRWGSYIKMDGLKDFNKKRGTQFDFIAVDEFRDIDPAARDVLIGRLRGVTYKNMRPMLAKRLNELKKLIHSDPDNDQYYHEFLDVWEMWKRVKHQIMYATTPPDNPLFLIKLHEESLKDDALEFIFATSWENQRNLPGGYIEMMVKRYDEVTRQREIEGKLIALIKKQFAYKWSKEKSVRTNLRPDITLPVWLCFDFNKDPMTVLAIQSDYSSYIKVFKEFRIKNGDVADACAQVNAHFGHKYFFLVTGDPAGRSGSALIKGNAYDIIKDKLILGDHDIQTPYKALEINDSRILLNSILEHLDVQIDFEQCPFLIDDLDFVEADTSKNGRVGIKKMGKNQLAGVQNETLTHLLDCFRYFLQTKFLNWLERPEH